MKTNVQFNPAHFSFDEKDFFSIFWRTFEPQNCWHIWLYMVGTPEESQEYTYQVKLCSPKYNEELSYFGQTVSLHNKKDEITSINRCLTIQDGGIERFCTKDRLNIYFTLNKSVES